jgi:hypothetical protein
MAEAGWTFEARVTSPNGLTVRAAVDVPASLAGPDSLELLEVAQMTAARMSKMIQRVAGSQRQSVLVDGEVPF